MKLQERVSLTFSFMRYLLDERALKVFYFKGLKISIKLLAEKVMQSSPLSGNGWESIGNQGTA